MEVYDAKQLVVRAGKELVESGLIARTWGNVSCRIDIKTFAITPSGRSYETLQPEEIVLCQLEDCTYEGEIKPSSEKRIHALIYQTYPDINFVIHTHQPLASVISAADINSMQTTEFPLLGKNVPIAAYGLPGTKTLRENVRKALTDRRQQAIIMAHHGAICFGKEYEETFAVAKQLEDACRSFLQNSYKKQSGAIVYEEKNYYNYYCSIIRGNKMEQSKEPMNLFNSRRTSEGFVLEGKEDKVYQFNASMPPEARIHRDIFLKRKDVNFIKQDVEYGLLEISRMRVPLKPLLDDYAQIVGGTAECAKTNEAKDIVKALGKRMGVVVPDCGALCLAATESDLHAVSLVLEKDALAQIGTRMIGGGKTISFFDCKLMHYVYTKSYAKKATTDLSIKT